MVDKAFWTEAPLESRWVMVGVLENRIEGLFKRVETLENRAGPHPTWWRMLERRVDSLEQDRSKPNAIGAAEPICPACERRAAAMNAQAAMIHELRAGIRKLQELL